MTERKLIRDIDKIDDDIIRAKRIIEDKLLHDADIITALHNEEIGYDPDRVIEYLNSNIYPYVRIPGTQDKVKNYICYQIDDIEEVRFNEVMKLQYIEFVVMAHSDDVDTPWGMKRHDLLGYLIKDIFNWSNMMGMQLKCIYDRESVMDTNYSCRTLKFATTKPSSLFKASMNNKYEYKAIRDDHVRSTEELING